VIHELPLLLCPRTLDANAPGCDHGDCPRQGLQTGQVFVHFNAHPHPLCRQWHQDILVYHLGSIGQRRLDILIG